MSERAREGAREEERAPSIELEWPGTPSPCPTGQIEPASATVDDPDMQLGEVSVYEHTRYRSSKVLFDALVTLTSH